MAFNDWGYNFISQGILKSENTYKSKWSLKDLTIILSLEVVVCFFELLIFSHWKITISNQNCSVSFLCEGLSDNLRHNLSLFSFIKWGLISILIEIFIAEVNNNLWGTLDIDSDLVSIIGISDSSACSLSAWVKWNNLKNVVFSLSDNILSRNANTLQKSD